MNHYNKWDDETILRMRDDENRPWPEITAVLSRRILRTRGSVRGRYTRLTMKVEFPPAKRLTASDRRHKAELILKRERWRKHEIERQKPISDLNYVVKVRSCLQCRREFMSEWSGHRVCKQCKSKAVFRDSGGMDQGFHSGGFKPARRGAA